MATDGMLALIGNTENALIDFLNSIGGNGIGTIRYWDDSMSEWDNIINATYGADYTLDYLAEGDLAGYTVLTVTAVPEPVTLVLLAIGGLLTRKRKRA
ncbi:MAG: hypothetical protein B6I25_04250 [Planctomycetales bacterium 4572_13]|nr:MAG: hypothetical protein B6I25_04250 [Planctomycetales bacterium 4572_13]